MNLFFKRPYIGIRRRKVESAEINAVHYKTLETMRGLLIRSSQDGLHKLVATLPKLILSAEPHAFVIESDKAVHLELLRFSVHGV